ncbi:MAG: argininosuccinate lyase [Chlamydiae bacterium]|nr:argininosuccinate lyase [Chlamydiota bacterium]MBI3265799.1 argininosuccinate lyase [Chlamydiota bacterium]
MKNSKNSSNSRLTTHDSRQKMWGGRFKTKAHPLMESFGASIQFDRRLASYDIQGSIAHAQMLAHCGILSKSDSEKMVKGLKEILASIGKGEFVWSGRLEDVHTHIESALREKIGDIADRLHTARSRNDQVVLDLRMYLKDEISKIVSLIQQFQKAFLTLASNNDDLIIPGFTHLQRAQPVLLAHHLLAYVEMLQRDGERLQDALRRLDALPLGACALAGTSFKIDRSFVAKKLGFSRILENSMDAVSDRDFVIEVASALAILGVHLSRLSEEMILWSSFDFGWIELPDAFTTGSSAMPQKKNPDVFELIRGKSGRLIGNLSRLLVMLKGLPLAYNRDLQEDKEAIFDSIDTVKASLSILIYLLPLIQFRPEALKEEEDFSSALDMAEYLVKKGVPFRQAHAVVGEAVSYCLDQNKTLKDLILIEVQKFSKYFESDFKNCLGWNASVNSKVSQGSTNPKLVKKEIEKWERRIQNTEDRRQNK